MWVRIIDIVSPGAYRIQTPPGSRMYDVFSVEHLKKYYIQHADEEPETLSNNDQSGEYAVNGASQM